MIRHSPCEKYIEYLLVRADQLDDIAILQKLRGEHLDFIDERYIARVRATLHRPEPFYPQDVTHLPSKRFITARAIYYLFHPDPATSRALRILDEPRTKELVETMLISCDAPALIAHRANRQGLRLTSDAVERYRFFFFNVALVDTTELQALLRLRLEYMGDGDDPQVYQAIKNARFGDARLMLARQPVTELASVMNSMRLGYMPGRLELTKLLSSARVAATVRASNAALTGDGPRAAAEARDWSIVVKTLGEVMADIGSPDTELQRELQSLALELDNSTVPFIGALSGGQHTTDLQPIETEGVAYE